LRRTNQVAVTRVKLGKNGREKFNFFREWDKTTSSFLFPIDNVFNLVRLEKKYGNFQLQKTTTSQQISIPPSKR
jgi:hypothetical protein